MGEKVVLFHYNEELKEKLQVIAKREGRTLKGIMTELLDEYIKVHGEGNPQHPITKFMEDEDFTGFSAVGVSLEKKRKYIMRNLLNQDDDRLNSLGTELWNHVIEWKNELVKH